MEEYIQTIAIAIYTVLYTVLCMLLQITMCTQWQHTTHQLVFTVIVHTTILIVQKQGVPDVQNCTHVSRRENLRAFVEFFFLQKKSSK